MDDFGLNVWWMSFMVRQKLPNLKMALEECDRDMRKDIDELKHKYGIHY